MREPSRHGLLSLIIPCYNVAAYLPAFLDSVAGQQLDDVELIFVDDGSTDESGVLIKSWIIDHQIPRAVLINQANGGLAAARNTGLAIAGGRWVSFPDPDDVPGEGYLRRVTDFLKSTEVAEVALVCSRVLILDDATGEVSDTHPLRYRFGSDTVIVSARDRPDRIHLQAASACYRLDRLREAGLEFDSRVRPNFEDGQLTARYLWLEEDPKIAFLPAAEYRYRRRADGSSLVQTSWRQVGRYIDVIEYGYLAVARELAERHGSVPRWAQLQVLYDLFFTLREDERMHAASGRLDSTVTDRFHSLVGELRPYLDDWVIDGYAITWTSDRMRQALLHGYRDEPYRPDEVRIQRMDAERRMGLLRYYFTGPAPVEELRYDGRPIRPLHAKNRAVEYLGRTLLHERMVWLPMLAELEITLDGRPTKIALGPPERTRYTLEPDQVWQRFAKSPAPIAQPDPNRALSSSKGQATSGRALRQAQGTDNRTSPIKIAKRLARRVVRTVRPDPNRAQDAASSELTPAQFKQLAAGEEAVGAYGDAWLFLDRDSQAQDNAEHLYRHVRDHDPEINAWFVLRSDSPDWPRLAADGFRLIDFGSTEHTLALLNCRHVLSSQADHYVTRPLDAATFGKPRWRFTFLQHGVMQDDLSRWLNSKPIQTFITSARPEFDAIIGDGTGWNFTTKEVRLTGLARHDALLAKAEAADPGDRRLVIMPTWRRWLLGPDTEVGNDRPTIDDFWGTEYARRWSELITDPELIKIAGESGASIVFVPHPNLRGYFAEPPWPDSVEVYDYAAENLQDLLARAALLITDYSSISAEAAYLQRPVIHYQFDAEDFYGGSHLGRSGGQLPDALRFGPVFDRAAEVIEYARAVAVRGFTAEEIYRDRMHTAFPYRDGRCCERIVEAVRSSRRPAADDEIFVDARSRADDQPNTAGGGEA